jgi:hypothetical protein
MGDYAKYNPWRAPGFAIPLNGCGIASGFLTGGYERITGEKKTFYQSATPNGYQAGDPGTQIPPLQGTSTYWAAGKTAEVMFAIDVNHGGGYQYRLCPKGADLSNTITESCFQQNPLPFATQEHIIRYVDGTELRIEAVDVSVGVNPPGSAWRKFPVPACNCDMGSGCTQTEGKTSLKAYSVGTKEEKCPTGLQFPKLWNEGYGYYGPNRKTDSKGDDTKESSGKDEAYDEDECLKLKTEEACSKDAKCSWTEFAGKGFYCVGARRLSEASDSYTWHIVDKVVVPEALGSYVLSWRWDCEQTPQIWTNCADIEVVKDPAQHLGVSGTGTIVHEPRLLILCGMIIWVFLV